MDVDTLARPQAYGSPSDTGDADESQTIGAPPQSGEDSVPADPADESTPQHVRRTLADASAPGDSTLRGAEHDALCV
jgi:hypothetical protein